MAKDRRNKSRPKVDLEADAKTPRSSTRGGARSSSKKRKKKTKLSRAALIIRCVLAVLVITMVVFLALVAKMIFDAVMNTGMPKQEMIDPILHDTTPTDMTENVAYYLIGILGEEQDSDSHMMSVVCYDKVNNTVNILELPNNTAIAEADGWDVDTVDAIFANPKPLDWCNTCRRQVYAPEINEGEIATHTVCGTQITSRKGSSTESLADFVNDQLALPVDEYFLLRPETLAELVGYVGGVDVELSGAYTLADTDYEPGIRTLSGDAVVEYVTDDEIAPLTRLVRQREVFAALLYRIFRMGSEMGYEAVEEDVIGEVMSGQYPIRSEADSKDITAVLQALSGVGVNNMTVYTLPGETTVDGDGDTVFSVHKDDLLTLLNNSFTPHGAKLSLADLLIPELANTVASDMTAVKLGDEMAEQTGKLLDQTVQAE